MSEGRSRSHSLVPDYSSNDYLPAKNNERLESPWFALRHTRELIIDYWLTRPESRSFFENISIWLAKVTFKMNRNVNGSDASEFVKKIKDWMCLLLIYSKDLYV
jgi:hypothetical protein